MSLSSQRPHSNLLLDSLNPKAFAALNPSFERVELVAGKRLSVARSQIRHAYFPISGMISLVHTYGNGSTIEVGLVGREGFWGTSALLGVMSTPIEAMVQGEGEALRVTTSALIRATQSHPELRSQFLRYTQFLYVQTALTAACNGTHNVLQRLCRWLLEADDRIGGDTIPITHEFLSYMLGTRRAGITKALGLLADQELITATRGRIAFRNRKKLETKSCDCYRILKGEHHQIFPSKAQRIG